MERDAALHDVFAGDRGKLFAVTCRYYRLVVGYANSMCLWRSKKSDCIAVFLRYKEVLPSISCLCNFKSVSGTLALTAIRYVSIWILLCRFRVYEVSLSYGNIGFCRNSYNGAVCSIKSLNYPNNH